jgi:hypothetical protein
MPKIPLFFCFLSIVDFPFPIRYQTWFGSICHLAVVGEASDPLALLGLIGISSSISHTEVSILIRT